MVVMNTRMSVSSSSSSLSSSSLVDEVVKFLKAQDLPRIKYAIRELNYDINQPLDKLGRTALHIAVENFFNERTKEKEENLEFIRQIILQLGPDININDNTCRHETVLEMSLRRGLNLIVPVLLEAPGFNTSNSRIHGPVRIEMKTTSPEEDYPITTAVGDATTVTTSAAESAATQAAIAVSPAAGTSSSPSVAAVSLATHPAATVLSSATKSSSTSAALYIESAATKVTATSGMEVCNFKNVIVFINLNLTSSLLQVLKEVDNRSKLTALYIVDCSLDRQEHHPNIPYSWTGQVGARPTWTGLSWAKHCRVEGLKLSRGGRTGGRGEGYHVRKGSWSGGEAKYAGDELWGEGVFVGLRLRSLVLVNVGLRHLPADIFHMDSLTVLKIDDNSLDEISRDVGKLTRLETFSCERQTPPLRELPDTIGQLTQLQVLCVGDNEIADIGLVTSLPRLRVLRCARNRIRVLPTAMSSLNSLLVLDISHNRLRCIPHIFAHLFSRLCYLEYYNRRLEPWYVRGDRRRLLEHLHLENRLDRFRHCQRGCCLDNNDATTTDGTTGNEGEINSSSNNNNCNNNSNNNSNINNRENSNKFVTNNINESSTNGYNNNKRNKCNNFRTLNNENDSDDGSNYNINYISSNSNGNINHIGDDNNNGNGHGDSNNSNNSSSNNNSTHINNDKNNNRSTDVLIRNGMNSRIRSTFLNMVNQIKESRSLPSSWLRFTNHVTLLRKSGKGPLMTFDDIARHARRHDVTPADVVPLLLELHRRAVVVYFNIEDKDDLARTVCVDTNWFSQVIAIVTSFEGVMSRHRILNLLKDKLTQTSPYWSVIGRAGSRDYRAAAHWLLAAVTQISVCVPLLNWASDTQYIISSLLERDYAGQDVWPDCPDTQYLVPSRLERGSPGQDVWPDCPDPGQRQITCHVILQGHLKPPNKSFTDFILHINSLHGARLLGIATNPLFLERHIVFHSSLHPSKPCMDCTTPPRPLQPSPPCKDCLTPRGHPNHAKCKMSSCQFHEASRQLPFGLNKDRHGVHISFHTPPRLPRLGGSTYSRALRSYLCVEVRGQRPCCLIKTVLDFIVLYFDDLPPICRPRGEAPGGEETREREVRGKVGCEMGEGNEGDDTEMGREGSERMSGDRFEHGIVEDKKNKEDNEDNEDHDDNEDHENNDEDVDVFIERKVFIVCPKCVSQRQVVPERLCRYPVTRTYKQSKRRVVASFGNSASRHDVRFPNRIDLTSRHDTRALTLPAVCGRWHNLGSWSRILAGHHMLPGDQSITANLRTLVLPGDHWGCSSSWPIETQNLWRLAVGEREFYKMLLRPMTLDMSSLSDHIFPRLVLLLPRQSTTSICNNDLKLPIWQEPLNPQDPLNTQDPLNPQDPLNYEKSQNALDSLDFYNPLNVVNPLESRDSLQEIDVHFLCEHSGCCHLVLDAEDHCFTISQSRDRYTGGDAQSEELLRKEELARTWQALVKMAAPLVECLKQMEDRESDRCSSHSCRMLAGIVDDLVDMYLGQDDVIIASSGYPQERLANRRQEIFPMLYRVLTNISMVEVLSKPNKPAAPTLPLCSRNLGFLPDSNHSLEVAGNYLSQSQTLHGRRDKLVDPLHSAGDSNSHLLRSQDDSRYDLWNIFHSPCITSRSALTQLFRVHGSSTHFGGLRPILVRGGRRALRTLVLGGHGERVVGGGVGEMDGGGDGGGEVRWVCDRHYNEELHHRTMTSL